MLLGVQFCLHGEKDILGGVCSSRARGRFCSSILVGLWRNHSDPVHRVVGGLQKRVVLRANWLVGQLNSIGMFPGSFVLFGQNLFQPERLSLCGGLVHGCGIMKDDELLTTAVTTKGAHFFAVVCPLSRLTLLNGHCIHPLTFYRLWAVSGAALYVP